MIYVKEGLSANEARLLSGQGDPDNPINRGAACSKGAVLFNRREIYTPDTGEQMINPKGEQKHLYRAPESDKRKEKDWDWRLDEIAMRIKAARDTYFGHMDEDGIIVNPGKKQPALAEQDWTNSLDRVN